MSAPESIRGYYCQVCQGGFGSFRAFRRHEDDGDVCPGGQP